MKKITAVFLLVIFAVAVFAGCDDSDSKSSIFNTGRVSGEHGSTDTSSGHTSGDAGEIDCSDCGGTGVSDCIVCGGDGLSESGNTCLLCDGSGKYDCFTCGGTGKISSGGDSGEDSGGGTVVIPDININNNTPGIKCTKCDGKGQVRCSSCDGSGKMTKTIFVPTYGTGGSDMVKTKVNCPACSGTGWRTCLGCGGTGKIN